MNDDVWFVDYATDSWEHHQIVIHGKRSEVRKILKKHLDGADFKINKMIGWNSEVENYEPES